MHAGTQTPSTNKAGKAAAPALSPGAPIEAVTQFVALPEMDRAGRFQLSFVTNSS
jgi:hypothetical protein